MKTVSITLYEYKELSVQAQQKVLTDLADINVFFDWREDIDKEAESIGLRILSFNREKNMCGGYFNLDTELAARRTLKQNKADSIPYIAAKTFRDCLEGFYKKFTSSQAALLVKAEEDFLKAMLDYYAGILYRESDELLSKEAVIATIEANAYLFLEDGTVFMHGEETNSEEVNIEELASKEYPICMVQDLNSVNGKVDMNLNDRNVWVEGYNAAKLSSLC